MTDSTAVDFDDSLVDWSPADNDETGYPDALASNDTVTSFAGLASTRDFPSHLWIEPRDYKEIARQNDKYKTWADDYRNRFTNQSPTHECVTHAFLQGMEICWNQQRQGAGFPVWFSALSVYAEANPRIRGGTYLQKVLGIGERRGILPEYHGPEGLNTQKDLFSHTLNCSGGNVDPWGGPWVPLNRFPDGWQNTARHFKVLESINPRSVEEIICLLLNGYAVPVGRAGHSIPYTKIVWRGDDLYAAYSDSYEVIRYDSRRMMSKAVGGSYSIQSMTAPDEWAKPAGEDMR